jgi:hypothetical protein
VKELYATAHPRMPIFPCLRPVHGRVQFGRAIAARPRTGKSKENAHALVVIASPSWRRGGLRGELEPLELLSGNREGLSSWVHRILIDSRRRQAGFELFEALFQLIQMHDADAVLVFQQEQ